MSHAASSPAPPRSRSNIQTPAAHLTRVPRIPRSQLRQSVEDPIPGLTPAGSSDDVPDSGPGRRTPFSFASRPSTSGVEAWDVDEDDEDDEMEEWEERRDAGGSRSQSLVGRVHGITRGLKSSRFPSTVPPRAATSAGHEGDAPSHGLQEARPAVRRVNSDPQDIPPPLSDASGSRSSRPRITFSQLMAMGAARRDQASSSGHSRSHEEDFPPSGLQQSITPRRMAPVLTASSTTGETRSSPTPSQGSRYGLVAQDDEGGRRVHSDNEAPGPSRSALSHTRITAGSGAPRTLRTFQSTLSADELRASLMELKESHDSLLANPRLPSDRTASDEPIASTSRTALTRHAHFDVVEGDSIGPPPVAGPPFVSWVNESGERQSTESQEWKPTSPGGSLHASDLSEGEQPPRKPLSAFYRTSPSPQPQDHGPSSSIRDRHLQQPSPPTAGATEPTSSRSTPTPTLPAHYIPPSSPSKTSRSASLSMGSAYDLGTLTSTPVRTATRPARLREDQETFQRRLVPRVLSPTADDAGPSTAGPSSTAQPSEPPTRSETPSAQTSLISPISTQNSPGTRGNRSRTTLAQDEATLARRVGRAPSTRERLRESTTGREGRSPDNTMEQATETSANERVMGSGSWQVVRNGSVESGEFTNTVTAGPSTPPRRTSRSATQFQVPATPEDLPSLPHMSDVELSAVSPPKAKSVSSTSKMDMKVSVDSEPRTLIAQAKTHLRAEPPVVPSEDEDAPSFPGPLLRRGERGEENEDWEKVDHPIPQRVDSEDDAHTNSQLSRLSFERASKGLAEDLKKPSRANVASSSGISSVPTSGLSSVPTSALAQSVASAIPGLPSPGGGSELARSVGANSSATTPRVSTKDLVELPGTTISGLPSTTDSSPARLVPQQSSQKDVIALARATSLPTTAPATAADGVFRIGQSDSTHTSAAGLESGVFRIIQPSDLSRSFEEEAAQMQKDLEFLAGKTTPTTPRRSILRRAQTTGERVIRRLDEGDVAEGPLRAKLDIEKRQLMGIANKTPKWTLGSALRFVLRTIAIFTILFITFGLAVEYGRRKGASLRLLHFSSPSIASVASMYADTPFERTIQYMSFRRPDAGYFPLDWLGYLYEAVDYYRFGPYH